MADLEFAYVNDVIFTQRKGKKGYDERQVDYYLNACAQLLSRFESYARVADFVGEPPRSDGHGRPERDRLQAIGSWRNPVDRTA